MQLDSTIYTCVFIPSEDGEVTPTQEKYRKQSYGFLKDLNNDLDTMISLGMNLYVDVSMYVWMYVCMYVCLIVSHLCVHFDH